MFGSARFIKIDRIDHGNNSLTDEKLVNYLVENKMALTVCPLLTLLFEW